MNGKWRLSLSVAGVIAVVAAVFTAGMTWAKIVLHVDNGEIHQGIEKKHSMIDSRVELLVGKDIEDIRSRIILMEQKLDLLRRDQLRLSRTMDPGILPEGD